MAKVVHFEIPVDDAQRARAFYRDVLDWQVADSDEGYWLVTAGPPDDVGADGALITRGELHASPVLVVGVGDLDATVAKAESAGGQVLHGRMEIPGVGWSAYVRDTEGNVVGLFQPAPGAG